MVVWSAQICEAHCTYARQTYGRKPRSTTGARSNKARTFDGSVCQAAASQELSHLQPYERLYMRRAQMHLHQAALVLPRAAQEQSALQIVERLSRTLAAHGGHTHWASACRALEAATAVCFESADNPTTEQRAVFLLQLARQNRSAVAPWVANIFCAMRDDEACRDRVEIVSRLCRDRAEILADLRPLDLLALACALPAPRPRLARASPALGRHPSTSLLMSHTPFVLRYSAIFRMSSSLRQSSARCQA